MGFSAFLTTLSLGLVSLSGTEATTPKGLVLAQAGPHAADPYVATQGYVAPQGGDYMTTPQGCTYRRTQAPGYPPRWILVINPYHVGNGKSSRGCKGMM